jgi:hypothetical protein
MTVPVWPAELGQWVTAPDFSIAEADGRLKTPPDIGPSKSRPRISKATQPVVCQLRCTLDQKARLGRFWTEDTRGGNLPFSFPDQVYNNTVLLTEDGAPILTEDDEPILIESWWLVRFTDAIQWRAIRGQGSWMASITLEIMP